MSPPFPVRDQELLEVLEGSPDGVVLFDRDFRVVYLNPEARHLAGQRELRGQILWELYPDLLGSSLEETYTRCMRERTVAEFEFFYPPLERWLEVRCQPVQIGLCVYFRNITARKQVEQQLSSNEEHLRTLADSIPQMVWMARADGHIFWYNQRWFDFTGTTAEEMEGWGWRSVHHPDFLDAVLERWNQSLRSGEHFEMEFPLRGKDGVFRWFLTRVNPVRNESGQVWRWYGTNTDIDEVKRYRMALQEETRSLELLNEAGSQLTSELDLHTLIQKVTDVGRQLSGAAFGAFFYNTPDEAYMLYTLSGAPRSAFESFGLPRATPVFAPTFHGEGPVRYDDVHESPRYGQWGPHYGMPPGHLPVRSYLAVPVVSRSGTPIGGLFFGHPEPGRFTERHEPLLVSLASQASIAIDNARLYEDLRRAGEQREELLEAERAARAQAERTSLLKDQFLATLSHELRTPMNSILGWAQLLRSGAVDEAELPAALETIERNARVQAQLIEDLLDMSSILSGKLHLELRPTQLEEVIEAALGSVRPSAEARGLSLTGRYEFRPSVLIVDPNRIQQILFNLLSNAIKFTPEGGSVVITLAGGDEFVEISVSDTGVGISPEFLPYVFERFRQADSGITRKFGGLGLGLSIVKHLTELHGGNVSVQSSGLGQGTTFRIRLPYRQAEEQTSPQKSPRESGLGDFPACDLTGLLVLVVDDEPDGRILVKRLLEECSAEVLVAGCADQALEILGKARPDLLISDIGMPELDGYQLLQQVREKGLLPPLGAIALTAFARKEDRERALAAGFSSHVRKPVEPSELMAAIARLLPGT